MLIRQDEWQLRINNVRARQEKLARVVYSQDITFHHNSIGVPELLG